jgi:Tol biopolymer transport system component
MSYKPMRGQLVWVDRRGEVLEEIGEPHEGLIWPTISPDGRFAAVTAGFTSDRRAADIWIYDLTDGSKRRLTFDEESAVSASWSPDGNRISYSSLAYGHGNLPAINIIPADGIGDVETVVDPGIFVAYAPDGESLVYTFVGKGNFDIWRLPLGESKEPQPLLSTEFFETYARVSPDSRYFAYQSNESGRFEVYIKTYPGAQGKWLVSNGGGGTPLWSRRGDKLYYLHEGDIMEVDVSTSPSLRIGTPRKLFSHEFCGLPVLPGLSEGFDVSADDERFLMVTPADEGRSGSEITVVENWFLEFRE